MLASRVTRIITKREILELSKLGSSLCCCCYHCATDRSAKMKLMKLTFRDSSKHSVEALPVTLWKRHIETATSDDRQHERPRASSTIDEEDVKRFSALANQWWKESGEFEALHALNELRVPLIRDALKGQSEIKGQQWQPLGGLKILDVGSGGGILAEPLARLGAFVIGIDASAENIRVAQTHAMQDLQVAKNVKYIHSSVEDLVGTEEGSFDGVVASEIIEHVFNAPEFIASCCKLVKPGGSLFLTTINKTYASYLLAVVAAENILNLVARGTHEWDKFISPSDLQYQLSQNNMRTKLVHGMCYNPLSRRWSWIRDSSVNYALHAVKPEVQSEPVDKS